MPRSPALLLVLMAAMLPTSCSRDSPADGDEGGAPLGRAAPSAPAEHPRALRGELVQIPGGVLKAGSLPGTPGRNPQLEPRQYEIELGPFRIDRLPYPNDPAQPPLTGVSRSKATQLCADRGSRLCTELEWERACKGAGNTAFPGGTSWRPECADEPLKCSSGFEVVGLGIDLQEWTASDVAPSKKKRLPAVRGAAPSASAVDHRCAKREARADDATAPDLGFRCCKGAPNAVVVSEPESLSAFRKLELSHERLTSLLKQHPRTTTLAQDAVFFREPDAANTVVARGPGDRKGFLFTVRPLLWSPKRGVELLVVSARSGDRTSFVLAYYVLAPDSYALAASFVMLDEPGPVALAFSGSIKPRMHFSTCWGCPGETGKLLFRNPETVAIVQP